MMDSKSLSEEEKKQILEMALMVGCDLNGDIYYDTASGEKYYVHIYNGIVRHL